MANKKPPIISDGRFGGNCYLMVASMPRTAITTATARTTINAVSIMGFPPLFDALLGYLHQSHVSIITKASHKTFDQQLHLGAVVSIDLINDVLFLCCVLFVAHNHILRINVDYIYNNT